MDKIGQIVGVSDGHCASASVAVVRLNITHEAQAVADLRVWADVGKEASDGSDPGLSGSHSALH